MGREILLTKTKTIYIGNIRRFLLLRMYTARKRSRRMPKDYQSGQFENGFVLSKEDFSEPLGFTYFVPHSPGGGGRGRLKRRRDSGICLF